MTYTQEIVAIELLEKKPGSNKVRVAGRRINVDFLSCFINDPEWPVERICEEYNLTPAQIYAAWAYYYEHKEEIDGSIEEGNALLEKVARPLDELKNKYKNQKP